MIHTYNYKAVYKDRQGVPIEIPLNVESNGGHEIADMEAKIDLEFMLAVVDRSPANLVSFDFINRTP